MNAANEDAVHYILSAWLDTVGRVGSKSTYIAKLGLLKKTGEGR